jgi:hypothetical protein
MNNKTQRRIHKYFFSHYFCFVFFRKNNIPGNAATNNTPNEGEKNSWRKSQGSRKVTICLFNDLSDFSATLKALYEKSERFSKEDIDLVERQLLIMELNLSAAKFLQASDNLLIVGN